MRTVCTFKGEKHVVLGFHEHTDEYMKEFLVLNKHSVNTNDPTGRFVRVDLVHCTDFRQEEYDEAVRVLTPPPAEPTSNVPIALIERTVHLLANINASYEGASKTIANDCMFTSLALDKYLKPTNQ